VLEAGDGRGAVEVLSDAPDPVDVIMLDYRLPDSNGLQLLARIRSLSPCQPGRADDRPSERLKSSPRP
jgi:CheY-like chemotaxis protein